MTYADFQNARRELHRRYHAAPAQSAARRQIDDEINALEAAHTRAYDLNARSRIEVRVRPANMGVSMGLQRVEDGRVTLYLVEFYLMTAVELRQTADLREVIQRYVDGALDELPPSGSWAHFTQPEP